MFRRCHYNVSTNLSRIYARLTYALNPYQLGIAFTIFIYILIILQLFL